VTPQSGSEQTLSAPSPERPAGTDPAAEPSPSARLDQVERPRPRPTASARPLLGFDACTAPSLKTMRVLRRRYAAVGVYIGGVNYACAYGNLSAAWLRSAAAMGWGILPIYVGRQATCWGYQGVTIGPRHPVSEGVADGHDAVRDAKVFGLAKGSPIYYDMEAYNPVGWPDCIPALLSFLGAWDRTVAAAGYVTGIYSSQDTGIVDMQRAAVARRPGFTPPDAIWIALWDNIASLSDGRLYWPLTKRDKQYAGDVTVTAGKIRLDIDRDIVGGPVAR
jgi:hypothetical protein